MRRLARGYSIHLGSQALIRRNDDIGIWMRRKAYPFGPFVRYEHYLREILPTDLIDPPPAPGVDHSLSSQTHHSERRFYDVTTP